MTSFLSFTQNEKKQCGQVPMGGVDVKAEVKGDFNKLISSKLDASLSEEGVHQGIYKVYVDCNGDVLKNRFEKGDLDNSQQEWLGSLLQNSKWQAAEIKGKAVTTIVFVTVNITNGKVETIIQ